MHAISPPFDLDYQDEPVPLNLDHWQTNAVERRYTYLPLKITFQIAPPINPRERYEHTAYQVRLVEIADDTTAPPSRELRHYAKQALHCHFVKNTIPIIG